MEPYAHGIEYPSIWSLQSCNLVLHAKCFICYLSAWDLSSSVPCTLTVIFQLALDQQCKIPHLCLVVPSWIICVLLEFRPRSHRRKQLMVTTTRCFFFKYLHVTLKLHQLALKMQDVSSRKALEPAKHVCFVVKILGYEFCEGWISVRLLKTPAVRTRHVFRGIQLVDASIDLPYQNIRM